jgi:hypothetical protein
MVCADFPLMKSLPTLLRNVAAGLLVTAAAPAFADTVVVSNSASSERSGLVLGASIDGGNIGCQTKSGDDCGDGAHPAGGFSIHVGGMITPSVAILGEAWGMAHTQDSLTASQVLATANVRGWILPRLWLQGGVGVARSKLTFDDGPVMASRMSSTVPALALAAGFEVVRSSTFGLDVELRAGSGLYEDDVRIYNAALGVGVSFF